MRLIASISLLLSLAGCRCASGDPPEPERLRLLTYNIHHGEGTDRKIDLARIANVIKSVEPDVVALQEVDVRTARSGGVDQAAELASLTGMQVRFGKAIDYQGGEYGIAVLLRWRHRHPLTEPLAAGPDGERRCALIVQFFTPGGERVLFVNTHLDSSGESTGRVAQAEHLHAAFSDSDRPAVLVGDLNAEPGSEPIQILSRSWSDPAAANGAPTYPSDTPRKRIDYLLFRPAARWRVLETRVIEEKVASDHRPLLVVLELLPG